MKRFLFIGHDAHRTGAPFVLLYLLQWIRENHPECEVDLLLLEGGELESEYRRVADVSVLPSWEGEGFLSNKVRRIRMKWQVDERLGIRRLPHLKRKYYAVISNTIVTLRHLSRFKQLGFKTVNWVHELEGAIAANGFAADFPILAGDVDQFIVGSKAVAAMLDRFGIDKPVEQVYEFSPRGAGVNIDAAAVRSELGLPPDTFVVGACGTLESRKGADMFVDLAGRFAERPDFHFIWIARENCESDPMYQEVTDSIGRLDLGNKMTIIRSAGSTEKYLAALDVFVLPSREDPFPLVCLEAANLGKPIICFADAGGMPEFVGEDAGVVAPLMDVATMAGEVERFYRDPAARERAGRAAKNKTETDFSPARSCNKIYSLLRGI